MTANFTKLIGYQNAELTGVAVNRHQRIAELRFTWTDQSVVTLALHGLQDFRVTDLGAQNVVSRLMLHDATAFAGGHVRAAISWARNFDEMSFDTMVDPLEQALEQIRSGTLALLILEPSWGAELVASFSRIEETRSEIR